MQLMIWGFFKKLVIADRASLIVNQVFAQPAQYQGLTLFVTALLYTIQIYTDFSGYVDIARGVGEILQIDLPRNFDHPYFATSIQDFWRRWHMTLSSWLRDYIYIPLGGNRKGLTRKYINILLVFFVSGLWHGVGIHFIIWGLLHGLYQVIGQLWARLKAKNAVINNLFTIKSHFFSKLCKCIFTFLLVSFAWIFFRADSLTLAFTFIKQMFSSFDPWVLWDGALYTLGLSAKGFCSSVSLASYYLKWSWTNTAENRSAYRSQKPPFIYAGPFTLPQF